MAIKTDHRESKLNTVYILLGSNINKEKNLPAAAKSLASCCKVSKISSVYETIPIGGIPQPLFFNAAIKIQTNLNFKNLKQDVLNQIELEFGREKSARKNSPRTIDLDIILFNKQVFTYGHRKIPDPDLSNFLHVAVPLAEISPNFIHPVSGIPLSKIAQELLLLYNKENPGTSSPLQKRADINLL